MFNQNGMFGKKEDDVRKENRGNVNLTPGLNDPPSGRSHATPPKLEQPVQETSKPLPKSDDASDSKVIVGPNVKLKGVEISDCDTLVVEGRVEAVMDSRVIKIAAHGVFSGTASIDVAEIHGRFEGELTARKQLIIYSTGRVSGKIRYGKISVEEGGELSGDVATITASTITHTSKGSGAATGTADVMTAYDPFAHVSKVSPGKASPIKV